MKRPLSDRATYWLLMLALGLMALWLRFLSARVDRIARMDPCWERQR